MTLIKPSLCTLARCLLNQAAQRQARLNADPPPPPADLDTVNLVARFHMLFAGTDVVTRVVT